MYLYPAAGWDEATSNPALWHVGLMQAPGPAGQLVAGRQAPLLDYFLGVGRVRQPSAPTTPGSTGTAAFLEKGSSP
jgi:hypothetical protein